jgi:hypothetical protein
MGDQPSEPQLMSDLTGPGTTDVHCCRVVAVDVGSVRKNFALAALGLPGRTAVGEGGSHPEGAVVTVLDALAEGVPVALGFEAPLMVRSARSVWRMVG